MSTSNPDFDFNDCGSVVTVVPNTDVAKAWVDENLALESWQWLGACFAVEPRYAGALAEGIADDGLTVST